jgi:hypothetical protein
LTGRARSNAAVGDDVFDPVILLFQQEIGKGVGIEPALWVVGDIDGMDNAVFIRVVIGGAGRMVLIAD